MSLLRSLLPVALAAALLAGCGQAPAPVPALKPAPAAARAATPQVERPSAPIVVQARALEDGPDDPPELAAEPDRVVVESSTASEPSPFARERTPYNVVVVERSAHTATIYWYTDVPTRGYLQWGRTWGFDKNQYTGDYVDDVPKNEHQITITGLRRFTKYRFLVHGQTDLGLRFPAAPIEARTKFWAWR